MRNLETFKDPKRLLTVGYVAGKQEQAKQLCQALELEVIRVDGEDSGNSILCRAKKPITEETLKVLDDWRSLIRFVRPINPVK
jgi:hypothetical protein